MKISRQNRVCTDRGALCFTLLYWQHNMNNMINSTLSKQTKDVMEVNKRNLQQFLIIISNKITKILIMNREITKKHIVGDSQMFIFLI